jgi:hypothetical protein
VDRVLLRAFFLACKCQEFRSTSRLGKGIFPENSGLGTSTTNFFEYSGLGKENFLEISDLGTGTANEFSKIPGELPVGQGFYSAHRSKSYSGPG